MQKFGPFGTMAGGLSFAMKVFLAAALFLSPTLGRSQDGRGVGARRTGRTRRVWCASPEGCKRIPGGAGRLAR